MRTAFVESLIAHAKQDPNIMLLTGDLGFNVLEKFRDELPNQYINAGVAEQNMMGVAAGLALSGKKVFAYSIIPFATFRCLEQIRDDICYHNLPVCVVGVGAGYSYSYMGATHHAIEDIAVMRALPNMHVICPGDPHEVRGAMDQIVNLNAPSYLRLGKAGEPNVHSGPVAVTIGKAIALRDGKDVTLIATSTMLKTATDAAELLTQKGLSVRVVSMHTVKPIDADAIAKAAKDTGHIVTIEEHSRIGGLGSAVADVMADESLPGICQCLSAPDVFAKNAGSTDYYREHAGLLPAQIVDSVLRKRA